MWVMGTEHDLNTAILQANILRCADDNCNCKLCPIQCETGMVPVLRQYPACLLAYDHKGLRNTDIDNILD